MIVMGPFQLSILWFYDWKEALVLKLWCSSSGPVRKQLNGTDYITQASLFAEAMNGACFLFLEWNDTVEEVA